MKFHKNFHVVALFAAMIALNAQAASVSPVQACRAVSAWAAANGSAFANPGSAVSAEPEYDTDGVTKLYYKVKMSNGGLVIASPDTDLDLVVAVLENSDGNFPKGHPLPSILKADMRNRLSVISSGSSAAAPRAGLLSVTAQSTSVQSAATDANLPEDVKESIRKSNAQWEKYGSAAAMRTLSVPTDAEIAPYIRRVVDGFEKGGRFTHWNQSSVGGKLCYNYYTPNNEVCGCVATAGAAIMQFFGNSTDIGQTGPMDGLNCYLYGKPITAETMPGAIDWSILPKTHGGTSDAALDETGRQLLGRVTYNFGVLVGMSWASEGAGSDSGSYVSNLAEAFKKYGFETARAVTFNTEDEGTSQYFKMVYAQNWAGAPVALGIQGDAGGHAVVACGYAKTPDDEELCRVFMGWGGYGDAWYKFPTVEDFTIVDEAVTMIGYDASKNMDPMDVLTLDEAGANDMFNKYGTVPVCGKSNRANAKLVFPGVTKGAEDEESGTSISFTLTATTDANGYFAVRIPVATTDLSVVHEDSNTALTIDPFDSKVLKDEKKDRSEVEKAMPGEMLFLVLNTTVKSTVASARAKALEEGKAVLMISGAGSYREDLLVDYITYLDTNTRHYLDTKIDISNHFVFVRLNSSDYSSPYGDGDPSIGIFDPSEGSADFRWWETNGRLAYNNFIDYEADNLDELNYVFNGTDATALTNIVNEVLAVGYDKYARRHSGIKVTVRAVDMDTGADITGIVGALPEYGVHENCWTNGEVAVFAAPVACTNEALGISYSCLGWTTIGLMSVWDVVRSHSNEISLAKNETVDFVWVMRVKAYRVNSAVWCDTPVQDVEGAISPLEAWRYPGERVTIVAAASLRDGMCGLYDWVVKTVNGVECEYSDICENGTAFSFTVIEPVNVLAKYKKGKKPASSPGTVNTVSISMPSELAGYANEADSALSLGANTTYDSMASLAALSSQIIDANGDVWECVGYVQNGVTNSPSALVKLSSGAVTNVELLWEQIKKPEAPVEPEPVPVPGPVSMSRLSRSADGEWAIAVEGAVKGCWYTLYAADDISKLAGSSDSWTANKVETKQAAADGESIVFKMTPTANAQFWRVKASGTSE